MLSTPLLIHSVQNLLRTKMHCGMLLNRRSGPVIKPLGTFGICWRISQPVISTINPVLSSDVVWDRLVLGQDRSETKKIDLGLGLVHCGLGLGIVLKNTVLSRPSSQWSWRTQQLFKYYL